MKTRQEDHDKPTRDSEAVRHLNENIQHSYNWKILLNASKHKSPKKNLKPLHIGLLKGKFRF